MTTVKTEPYRCDRCWFEGSYYGALRHGDQAIPVCKIHGEMQPVKKEKK